MRNLILALAIGVAITAVGFLSWNAEATTLALPAPTQNYSPVEKVACGGPGPNCPWGRTWVCRPRGCWCAPCGGYWRPWRY
jgi:hypothetical protein